MCANGLKKTVMPRETLKEWLVDADGLWCVRPLDVDGDLVKMHLI